MVKRVTILFADYRKMAPEGKDALPGPMEFRAWIGKGKARKLHRSRRRWVGFGVVDEGPADGSEPVLIVDSGQDADTGLDAVASIAKFYTTEE